MVDLITPHQIYSTGTLIVKVGSSAESIFQPDNHFCVYCAAVACGGSERYVEHAAPLCRQLHSLSRAQSQRSTVRTLHGYQRYRTYPFLIIGSLCAVYRYLSIKVVFDLKFLDQFKTNGPPI